MMEKIIEKTDTGMMMWNAVCCKYHWLIKELLWVYRRAIGEQSQVEKTKLNAGRKKEEFREAMEPLPETNMLKLS